MKKEISAGAVIFRRENGAYKFLLLHYPSASHRSKKDYWDFVKGHVDAGESELQTIIRETKEETGIDDLEFIDGFRESMKYFFRFGKDLIFKTVIFRLAQTKSDKVILSGEHNDFSWLSYQEAFDRLSFKNARSILKKANDFLNL